MKSFIWGEHFLTGLPAIDLQHQHLLSLINQFGALLAENKIVFSDIDGMFKELTKYAQSHFLEEEELMASAGIDQRHTDHHIDIHRSFVHEVAAMHANISPGNLNSAKQLLNFLTYWLAYHILGSDQDMARQVIAIQAGVEPDKAYEEKEREKNSAMEPLLIALNGLFEQVSRRNEELLTLNEELEGKVAQRTKELSEANLYLKELSLTDSLTGLPNRRCAMQHLSSSWKKSIQDNSPLVCMMIDADYFKEVNDTCGHDAGDQVLKELARTLQHSFRSDDSVYRLGGDEFFIICPDTDKKGGMHIAELTRKAVSKLRVTTGDKTWHGSISIGIAYRTPDLKAHEELIKAADQGLYTAKQDGKNCIRTII